MTPRRPPSIFERNRILTGICVAAFIAGFVLVLAEVSVRVFLPKVQFVGQTASLIQPERFGATPGNRPLAVGESWGANVATDQFGFRISSERARSSPPRCTTIIIGDSVPFGIGVAADKIFPTLLTEKLGTDVCNTGVIGYGIDDYEGLVNSFVLPNRHNLGIFHAILFVTLNDIYGSTPTAKVTRDDVADRIEGSVIERLARALRTRFDFNGFLIGRSTLYLALKGLVYDSSRWWFLADYNAYHDDRLVKLHRWTGRTHKETSGCWHRRGGLCRPIRISASDRRG